MGVKGITTMNTTDTTETKNIIFSNRQTTPEEVGCVWDDELDDERPCQDWEEAGDLLNAFFDDERRNLNKDIDGVIVGFADLGLWNGHRNGGKVFGDKANSILDYGEDYNEWYGDGEDIRGTFTHHDGTNCVLFRIAESREEAEHLVEQIAYGGMTEDEFCAATKSLYPVVANIYGWK